MKDTTDTQRFPVELGTRGQGQGGNNMNNNDNNSSQTHRQGIVVL